MKPMKFSVVLHDVRSVHNVGSVFRTADAAGAAKIWCCGITPAPVDRFKNIRKDFAKVALGAHEYVPWEIAKDTGSAIKKLKNEGFAIFAIEQAPGATPYHALSKAEIAARPLALVLGNEVEGLSREILGLADRIIEIPMFGKKESLNVAVAFGVVAFGLRFLAEA